MEIGMHPRMLLEATIEDHDVESEAYEQSSELFKKHPDLAGIEACDAVVQTGHKIQPDAKSSAILDAAYLTYR